MPWSWKRDPVTGDLVKDGKGGFVKTFTAENLVRNQLVAHRDRCWQDAELGSRLHELERFITDPDGLASDDARLALERIQAAGRISNIEVTAEEKPGRVIVATRFRDTSTNQVVTAKIPVSKGA